MLHPILSKLAVSRARLLLVIDDLSDTGLDVQPPNSGWSVRQHLTHLVASEEDHCRVIEVIACGQLDRLTGQLDLDTHNARRLAEVGVLSLSQLRNALDAQRQRTETLFTGLNSAQLEQTGPHPALGDMSVNAIFRMMAIHEQMHTRNIEAIRAQMDGS